MLFRSGETERRRERAINALADRLLASPHYGERWARHWLDVARYADTKGYVYAREERFFVHAYAYRDWVVRALNSDLPYDKFLQLQIAADQIVEGSKVQGPKSNAGSTTPAGSNPPPQTPNARPYPPSRSDLAALGFLTGGRRFLGVTADIIDDRIDVVKIGRAHV